MRHVAFPQASHGHVGPHVKKVITHFCLLTGSFALVLFFCVRAQHEYKCFGSSIGAGGLLLWPAVLLARASIARTWLLLAIAALFVLIMFAWGFRTKKLLIAPALGFALPIVYCVIGAFAFRHIAIPLPTVTPYETDATKKQEYTDSFTSGYRTGIAGTMRTYCFAPEHTTRGFYDGMYSGLEIYNRCLGVNNTRNLINRSAARDGVMQKSGKDDVQPAAVDYRLEDKAKSQR